MSNREDWLDSDEFYELIIAVGLAWASQAEDSPHCFVTAVNNLKTAIQEHAQPISESPSSEHLDWFRTAEFTELAIRYVRGGRFDGDDLATAIKSRMMQKPPAHRYGDKKPANLHDVLVWVAGSWHSGIPARYDEKRGWLTLSGEVLRPDPNDKYIYTRDIERLFQF